MATQVGVASGAIPLPMLLPCRYTIDVNMIADIILPTMTSNGVVGSVDVDMTLLIPTISSVGINTKATGTSSLSILQFSLSAITDKKTAYGSSSFNIPLQTIAAIAIDGKISGPISIHIPTIVGSGNKNDISTSIISIPMMQLLGTVSEHHCTIIDFSLPLPTISASGLAPTITSSSSSISIVVPTMRTIGIMTFVGAASSDIPMVTAEIVGIRDHRMTANLSITMFSMFGVAQRSPRGALISSIPMAKLSGRAERSITSNISLTIPVLTVASFGEFGTLLLPSTAIGQRRTYTTGDCPTSVTYTIEVT